MGVSESSQGKCSIMLAQQERQSRCKSLMPIWRTDASAGDRLSNSTGTLAMLKEHERVVLTRSMPAEGLEAGDVGAIVHVYHDGEAYEVEFVALDGHTTAVATLEADQVRPITSRSMTHWPGLQAV